jgi:hypothetical protein
VLRSITSFSAFVLTFCLILTSKLSAAATATGDDNAGASISVAVEGPSSPAPALAPTPTSSVPSVPGIGGRPSFAVGIKASSLGIGGEFGVSMTRLLDFRAGFNAFNFSHTFKNNGIDYSGTLQLRSADALLDIKPLGDWFHISPGVLLYNGNQITAKTSVPGGQVFDLGNASFKSSLTNPIGGTGKMTVPKAAPMVLFGFGTLVPHNHHFTFYNDFGVVFQGSPKTTLNLTGSACDAVTGLACVNAATDPTVQAQVQAEQTKINKDTTIAKFYPVFALGFGFRW